MKAKLNQRATGLSTSRAKLLDTYRTDLRAAGRSPKYLDWTLANLHRFFRFVDARGALKPISSIGRKEARDYIRFLQKSRRWPNRPGKGRKPVRLSPSSVQGHVRSIKAFWGFLAREGYIESNPMAQLTLPKIPRYLIPTLTEDQIKRLAASLDRNSPCGAKYYCILLLLLDSGMRVSELVCIKMTDLETADRLVTVLGKGRKERRVPFSKRTRKELVRYIERYRPLICSGECSYLFPTADGDHISVSSVQQSMKRLRIKAGLGSTRCSPHICRHTFATMAMTNGADPFVVRDIMGHSSLQTTLKYVHLQPRDLRTQHDKFSPVENMLK